MKFKIIIDTGKGKIEVEMEENQEINLDIGQKNVIISNKTKENA